MPRTAIKSLRYREDVDSLRRTRFIVQNSVQCGELDLPPSVQFGTENWLYRTVADSS